MRAPGLPGALPGLFLFATLPIAATASAASPYNWADDDSGITQSAEFAESKAVCRALKGMTPPPGDRPDAATAATLSGCSSEALYYGIGVPADPERARLCAYVERDAARSGLAGAAMLMTLYANGVGASRDLDLATAFACEIEGAPAESDGRVLHLQQLKAQGWTGDDFGFCDDITSGYASGLCAAHEAAMEDARRSQRFAALTASWSAGRQEAFEPLQKAANAYIAASVANEVDLGGTARAAFQIEQEQALEAEFQGMLVDLEEGGAPSYTAGDYAAADARLNAVYRQVVGAEDPTWGTVTKTGIRTAQRAWLPYRDAWVEFAATAYPSVTPDSIRTRLTRERTVLLEAFAP